MRGTSARELLARLRQRRARETVYVDFIDASFHVDTEAVCPDCLQWIGPDDYVRRNAFDLLEHEVCPPLIVRALGSSPHR